MIVETYEGLEVLDSHYDIWHVEIELEDGQRFDFRERDGTLSVSVDGQLIVLPYASNVVRLRDGG